MNAAANCNGDDMPSPLEITLRKSLRKTMPPPPATTTPPADKKRKPRAANWMRDAKQLTDTLSLYSAEKRQKLIDFVLAGLSSGVEDL